MLEKLGDPISRTCSYGLCFGCPSVFFFNFSNIDCYWCCRIKSVNCFILFYIYIHSQITCVAETGDSSQDVTRQEAVALLCIADRTHSQLTDSLPEKCGLSGHAKDFEQVLKAVSSSICAFSMKEDNLKWLLCSWL